LQGLSFVLEYYHCGCPSWNWFYPHNLPPTMIDISTYSEKFITKDFELSKPVSAFEQLLYVLPKYSHDLLPKSIQTKLKNSEIYKLYPDNYEIIPIDNTKEYNWKTDIPNIDKNSINEFYQNLVLSELSEKELKRNQEK